MTGLPLWTAIEAAAATAGVATTDWECTGISIDTRTLEPGDLFVALKAARDGHDFVAQALDAGAAAALVSHRPEGVAEDAPLLIVPDVQVALESLGRAARARMNGKVVAVTGSVGKTSTKEMLRTVLTGQGQTHASVASYNNHWGVPLTLARMPQETDFAVIEIGMNHPGEIAPLVRMARPHVAIVTTVAPAHLAAFENVEGIAREKASIFSGLERSGVAIYNADLDVTPILSEIAEQHSSKQITFGEAEGATLHLKSATVNDSCTVASVQVAGKPVLFKVAVPGRHYAMNALSVLGTVKALKLDMAIAVSDLGQWAPGAGRGQREVISLDRVDPRPTIELIDDAYNANPASMAASLEVLAAAEVTNDVGRISRGRRIAYLGDMGELGPTEADIHRDLATLPSMEKIDRVHCIGPLMRNLHDALPAQKRGRWAPDAATMVDGIAKDLDAGDVVLAKGSNYTGVGRVVDAIRKLGHPAAKANEDNS
ncbi:UDP-N-acetylmuramoyl-tripeptide--D-alanyl-D-alanine ligase [Cognatishimia maritima]|uniref:UDP-N-acetylmuramoyl-tripeptide--D-alanyl-D-alanine ligase n=1 Tax=Cognatishimia maritima TaxID=870908 RepID=A0A1M5VFL8_9RHOB|nr:UDP-N-acetylmuramoyl-tripeptide--D-alanyl-D-alanine ligase [Cognatishimia maritima]SHH73904.1 UDP-N-acetylmuramoyl-tripeptide--D-alanyl-D-alanine ligase [Cognatishimia maritima]